MRGLLTALVMIGSATAATAAAAQPPSNRFTIAVNGGVESATSRLQDDFRFDEGPEAGTITARYPAPQAVLVDGGLAVRLAPRIRGGVVVSYSTATSGARIDAGIPHPFHFDRLRPVEGSSSKLTRNETSVHAQIQYVLRLTRRLHAVVGGGPTYFRVTRHLIDRVEYDQEYPYDAATFRFATSRRARGSGMGFNAGSEIVWSLTRRTGLGASVRFARGSVDLRAAGGREVGVDAGGVQAGAGLRVSF